MAYIWNFRSSQKAKPEQGQSLVEFALVLTFIVIPLIFALIETSVILYKYVSLTNAAREGARTGSIYLYVGDPGGVSTAVDNGRGSAVADTVKKTVGPLIVPPVDCSSPGSGAANTTSCQINYYPSTAPITNTLRSTDPLTITLTHVHPFLFGALGSTINLNAQSSMRIEPSMVISGP
jgi:Flp pilus assembly protein TadG